MGAEFHVNTYTYGVQFKPSAASDADGDFVVVWQDGNGRDGYDSGVFARRFAKTGAALATEFQVNTFTTSGQRSPSVTRTGAGDFVIVWTSGYTYGPAQDGDGSGRLERGGSIEPLRLDK